MRVASLLRLLPTTTSTAASSSSRISSNHQHGALWLRSGTTAFISSSLFQQPHTSNPLRRSKSSSFSNIGAPSSSSACRFQLPMGRTITNTHTNISYEPMDDNNTSISYPSSTLLDSTILIGRREQLRSWLLGTSKPHDESPTTTTTTTTTTTATFCTSVLGFEPTDESNQILLSTIDSIKDNNGRGSGSTATAFLSVVPPPPAATLSDDTVASTSVPHRV